MKSVKTDISFPELERSILAFWRENKTFQRSLSDEIPAAGAASQQNGSGAQQNGTSSPAPAKKPPFVFYDGPPFATGLPHYGHLLAGTIKDVVGRFFTMKGYVVDRRFGWDCHGVPVEFEIQKSLGLHGVKAIREFGVGKFNEECRKIVLRYTQEWRQFVERSGRWVDFDREYRTMDSDYMESIWWAFKCLWDRGLIYEGVKCVPYSPAINTPLSNFEANLNYKMTQDPAVTVRVELIDDMLALFSVGEKDRARLAGKRASAYIWTTTPWTLPSNMAIAVGPEVDYALIENPKDSELVIVADLLADRFFPGIADALASDLSQPRKLATLKGKALEGTQYRPFFSYFEDERERNAFRMYPADYVSAEDGTGLVHLASFGEDDLAIFQQRGIAIVDPVDDDGKFMESVPDFAGLDIKAADPKIIAELKRRGALVQHTTIEHSYPFCYRTDKPLIYKSISSWFVRVEQIRDLMVEANNHVNWVPDHVRQGRFGKWLEGARDWAISRNRFWGTPIPVWRCESCGESECLGSVAELKSRSKSDVTDLHSHFIDELTLECQKCNGKMSRIPQLLDCWFESGAMPYAQIHYPFENEKTFEEYFPADFIAEGLDQTRGWFYTLLVLSVALFGRSSFRNVVVNGIVLAEDGKKMSKSLKNYPAPDIVMEKFGADAMRLYLLASGATRAEDLRFSEAGVQGVVRQTLLPLWNSYNFFVTYALVDGWTPDKAPATPSDNVLDRWMMSKTASLVSNVDSALSQYKLYAAAPLLIDFVDQLTNWYIRLNRRRFWSDGTEATSSDDKSQAYATLHKALVAFVRVLAPLAPFITEEIFQNLVADSEGRNIAGAAGLASRSETRSVHLEPFPTLAEFTGAEIDQDLEEGMELFESVILLGRNVRNDEGIKVRQPLGKMVVVHPSERALRSLTALTPYIREELNVKDVELSTDESQFVSLGARLNTKALGKVLGPKLGSGGMRELQKFVETLTSDQILGLETSGKLTWRDLELTPEDVLVQRQARPGVKGVASSGQITVMIDLDVTAELRAEGLAREFVNRVQKIRKDFDFAVTDRIIVEYMTASQQLLEAIPQYRDYIMDEILAVELRGVNEEREFSMQGRPEHLPVPQEIEDRAIIIGVTRIQA